MENQLNTETEEAQSSGKSKMTVRNQYPDRLKMSPEALIRLNQWIA